MLRDVTIPLASAWNTWSSRPAELVFLPLGVRVTPVGYADSQRSATLFPAGDDVRYGRHALDASIVELQLSHADTTLAWRYSKSSPFEVAGFWKAMRAGEWGLRFWINLCLSTEEGHSVRYDPVARAAIVKVGHRFVALATEVESVLVTGHESVEALADHFEAHGYFHTGARSEAAPLLALRFNLEMMPQNRFGIAIADRADLAIERAHACVTAAETQIPLPEQTGPQSGALDALRDVVAWNTVYDEIDRRPYTSISRNWNLAKFGGFGVWLNDQQYAAMLASALDPELARQNLAAVLASATPQGNLACLVAANDAWVDRSQSPIGSFLLWLMHLRTPSRALLELAYDTLARNHEWWRRCRDPLGCGLVSFGTSDVGEGLYKGTAFGARNESAMDNAPIHDEAPYDPQTRSLASLDVGLNSLLALDAEMLALIADELGRKETNAFRAEAERLRRKIRDEFWDPRRCIFANRLRSGAFVRSVGPTSFFPMLAGAATPEQIQALMGHLADPAKFGGEFGIPSVSRDDPAFKDNRYWRGRIWPPLNYLVWQGLRRCGEDRAARALAANSYDLFRRAWDGSRLCPENYNAVTGEALDQADTERFYTWGALMALLGTSGLMDIAPWHGFELTNDGEAATLGPLPSPAGLVTASIEGGLLTLASGPRRLLVTNMRGSISHLRFGEDSVSLVIPAAIKESIFLHFPEIAAENVREVLLDGREIAHAERDRGILLTDLARHAGPGRLELFHRVTRAGPSSPFRPRSSA